MFWLLSFILKNTFEKLKLDQKDVQENHLLVDLVASHDKIWLSDPNGLEKEAPCATERSLRAQPE